MHDSTTSHTGFIGQMLPPAQSTVPPAYPGTRASLVLEAASADPLRRRVAHERLLALYWRPAYAHLRLRWHLEPADAEDLVQDFFVLAVQQEYFREYEPARSRFRSFLRLCLDRFAAKTRRAERRIKRGGGAAHLPLDFVGIEQAFVTTRDPAGDEDPFDAEWARVLFDAAIEALAAECATDGHQVRLEVFRRYDLGEDEPGTRPSYRDIGAQLGLPVTQVTNHLAWCRRRLRQLLLDLLRSHCFSEAEFHEEAAALFGRSGR